MGKRILIFVVTLLCLLAEANANPTIIVVGDDSPPFRIFDQNNVSGIYFDTIREIGVRMTFTPKFIQVPFKRALNMIRKGDADMMPGPNFSKERASYMIYTSAVLPAEPKAFYYKRPKNKIERFNDLEGKRVATTLGKDYNNILKESPKIQLDIVCDYELAILKVLFNRNDIVVLPEFQGDYLLRSRGFKIFKSPFKLKGKPSHICLSFNSVLVNRQRELQDTMAAIIDDGTFQKILDKYSLQTAH